VFDGAAFDGMVDFFGPRRNILYSRTQPWGSHIDALRKKDTALVEVIDLMMMHKMHVHPPREDGELSDIIDDIYRFDRIAN
jgi:hypothetical protein